MDEIYFPDELWPNRELEFTSPSPSTWKVTEKVDEEAWILSRKDAEVYRSTSWAAASFKCQNSQSPIQKGIVDVYMQLPIKGTLVLPPDMRRRQASDKLCERIQFAVESYERLSEANCDFTPRFIGFRHEKQDDGSLVPGGFLSHWAYTQVPGAALSDGTGSIGYVADIPGVQASLAHSESKAGKTRRRIPDGVFWKLPQEERARIGTNST